MREGRNREREGVIKKSRWRERDKQAGRMGVALRDRERGD